MDKNQKEKIYASMGYTPDEIADCLRLDERVDRMRGCKPGEYPWDHWQTRALAAGVPERLAQLGRSLMREYFNHGWDNELATVCGYDDDGEALVALALAHPELAARQWQRLLDTDGLRGEYTPQGKWESWTDAQCARAILDLFPRPSATAN